MKPICMSLSEISPKLNKEIEEMFPSISPLEVIFPSDEGDNDTNTMLSEMFIHAPNILIQENKKDGVAIAIDCKPAFVFDKDSELLDILPENAKRRLSAKPIRQKVLNAIGISLQPEKLKEFKNDEKQAEENTNTKT